MLWVVCIWFAMWMVTWPALLADMQAWHLPEYRQKHFRDDLGAAMLFGLLPPMWVVCPFVTGFYQHGFQFSRGEG